VTDEDEPSHGDTSMPGTSGVSIRAIAGRGTWPLTVDRRRPAGEPRAVEPLRSRFGRQTGDGNDAVIGLRTDPSRMEEPLVSVVTPAYEAERFVEATFESVRDQTYDRVEHIVMDGGSTDRTTEILAPYEDEADHDLTWYSGSDGGMYDAIEKGFERASGDVLAWLNADDEYLPWAARVAVDALSEPGVEWVTGHPA